MHARRQRGFAVLWRRSFDKTFDATPFDDTGPVSDFGSSHGSITVGVRVGIR